MEKQVSAWLILICFFIFSLILFGYHKDAYSQLTRDEETSKEVDKYNPLQAPKAVIDNTVNQVLPFDIPTDSKISQDEKACFDACAQERDTLLEYSTNELDRGYAWAAYQKCKSECPEKAANQNKNLQGDAFNDEQRYPAGSATSIDQ